MPSTEGDVMGDIERWECPAHGFDVATFGGFDRDTEPVCGCGRKLEWIGYVRADALRGAVEDLEALRAVLSPVSAFISDGARVNRAREMVAELLDRLGGR